MTGDVGSFPSGQFSYHPVKNSHILPEEVSEGYCWSQILVELGRPLVVPKWPFLREMLLQGSEVVSGYGGDLSQNKKWDLTVTVCVTSRCERSERHSSDS